MCTEALLAITKIWKQPTVYQQTDWQNIYNGILLSHKKNEILPFVAIWMDLKNIMLSEMSDRKIQILYGITYMWNLKNETNECI